MEGDFDNQGKPNCVTPGCKHRRFYVDGKAFSDCTPHRCQCQADAVYWNENEERWQCSRCFQLCVALETQP